MEIDPESVFELVRPSRINDTALVGHFKKNAGPAPQSVKAFSFHEGEQITHYFRVATNGQV